MRRHEDVYDKSRITFAGITTILAADDASVPDCVTIAQFHLFTNRNRCSEKIDISYAIPSNTAATIYVVVQTIIKPSIIPPIGMARDGVLFCEPEPIPLIWLGYKCDDVCSL